MAEESEKYESRENKEKDLSLDYAFIQSLCEQHKIKVVWGRVEQTAINRLNVILNCNFPEFSDILVKFSPSLVVLTPVIFDDKILKRSIRYWEDDDEVLAALSTLKENAIELVAIEFYLFLSDPNVILRYTHSLDVYEWLKMEPDDDEDDYDDEGDDDTDDTGLSDEYKESLARKVAEDDKFLAAKNETQRQYLAEKILADENLGTWDFKDIFKMALAIFYTEIKPGIEENLLETAKELKTQGLTTKEIAARLGKSAKKIKDLLS